MAGFFSLTTNHDFDLWIDGRLLVLSPGVARSLAVVLSAFVADSCNCAQPLELQFVLIFCGVLQKVKP